jgi:hypothetical protein
MRTGTGKKLQLGKVGVNANGYRVGESHHRAKLSDKDIETILYLREAGLSYGQIARKFDDGVAISKSTVRDVCNGRIRAQAPVAWRKGA